MINSHTQKEKREMWDSVITYQCDISVFWDLMIGILIIYMYMYVSEYTIFAWILIGVNG